MNKLLSVLRVLIFLEILSLSSQNVFSNPDRFAENFISAARANSPSLSRQILQAYDQADLSDLVSNVIREGTVRGGTYGGRTLPALCPEVDMEMSSLPTACDLGSVKLVLGSLNRVERASSFNISPAEVLNMKMHMIPLPYYTALLTFELSDLRGQMGIMFNFDDSLIVKLRSFFPEDKVLEGIVFEKDFLLRSPVRLERIER